MQNKLVIISAPSGAGKTTIVQALLQQIPELAFSISATSREKRSNEVDGKDYYFLGYDGFREAIDQEAFLEWEEVYPGQFYGTLKKEVDRIWAADQAVIFDMDVVGGMNLKRKFGVDALALFIMPPSAEALVDRLRARNTEPEEKIQMRLQKAHVELQRVEEFDQVVINDHLERAIEEVRLAVQTFLKQ